MRCKKCRSRKVIKTGFRITKGARLQRYQCKVCGHIFVGGRRRQDDNG